MTDELVVIPRAELERARNWATKNVHSGILVTASCAAVLVVTLFLQPFTAFAVPFVLGGGIGGVFGVARLVRAWRARARIDAKLRAQALPPARLLGP